MKNNCVFLHQLPHGYTQNIEVWIEDELYLVDVNKNRASACVEIYKKTVNNGKYGSNDYTAIHIKPDGYLCKDILNHRHQIHQAQTIARCYSSECIF